MLVPLDCKVFLLSSFPIEDSTTESPESKTSTGHGTRVSCVALFRCEQPRPSLFFSNSLLECLLLRRRQRVSALVDCDATDLPTMISHNHRQTRSMAQKLFKTIAVPACTSLYASGLGTDIVMDLITVSPQFPTSSRLSNRDPTDHEMKIFSEEDHCCTIDAERDGVFDSV